MNPTLVPPATGRVARNAWFLVLLVVADLVGCRRDPTPIDAEQTALKALEALNLIATRVTDRGLAMLQKSVSLRYVYVRSNDGLTPAGIEALKRALPGVSVHNEKKDAPATK